MLPYLKRFFRRELTLSGGAVVVALVLALFGLGEVGAREFHQVRLKKHVREAIPKVRAETARELRVLVRAIEAYKNTLGCYPPDHQVSQNPPLVDVITNQLLYELVGTIQHSADETFVPDHFPSIRGNLLKQYFNVTSFKNCAQRPELLHQFLSPSEISGTMGVSDKPPVGVLAFYPAWEGMDPELTEEISLASWRYNSSAPVHNPGTYDLWIEVPVSGKKIVVGNW